MKKALALVTIFAFILTPVAPVYAEGQPMAAAQEALVPVKSVTQPSSQTQPAVQANSTQTPPQLADMDKPLEINNKSHNFAPKDHPPVPEKEIFAYTVLLNGRIRPDNKMRPREIQEAIDHATRCRLKNECQSSIDYLSRTLGVNKENIIGISKLGSGLYAVTNQASPKVPGTTVIPQNDSHQNAPVQRTEGILVKTFTAEVRETQKEEPSDKRKPQGQEEQFKELQTKTQNLEKKYQEIIQDLRKLDPKKASPKELQKILDLFKDLEKQTEQLLAEIEKSSIESGLKLILESRIRKKPTQYLPEDVERARRTLLTVNPDKSLSGLYEKILKLLDGLSKNPDLLQLILNNGIYPPAAQSPFEIRK